jgi:hypothetical protein
VRIARTVHRVDSVAPPTESDTVAGSGAASADRRQNVGGSQRVVRVTIVYLVALVALYAGFVLYDRSAPGGSAAPESNGVLLFTGIFLAFALAGALLTLHPAPRAVVVAPDRVTVVGRWGSRRVLPPLDSLSSRAVRRYPVGWLSDAPVEQVELWGPDAPLRTYLVEDGLFRGAKVTDRGR